MTRLSNVAAGGKVTASIENSDRAGINKTMQLMTPTSVSTGSIGTYGAVTFSAASSVSLNGCFTSEFDWYDVIFDITTSAATNLRAGLRLAGTDAATAYDRQSVAGVSTTTTSAQGLNQTTWPLTGASVIGRHSGRLTLFGPALAASTSGNLLAGSAENPMTTSSGFWSAILSHRTATAYDGITIAPGSGNITGTIRVYGII